MWPAEIKCGLLNHHSYRGPNSDVLSKALKKKKQGMTLLQRLANQFTAQITTFNKAVTAFEIEYEVANSFDYDDYSVTYTDNRVRSWYKNGTDRGRRQLILDLEKLGFFEAGDGFDLTDSAHYRLICAMITFHMYCMSAVQRAVEQGDQTPVPTLQRNFITDKEAINAVAIDENNRGTIRPYRHDIDLLDEYKTFETVDYMIKNEYYATEDFLVAKLLATKLEKLGKTNRARLCQSRITDEFKDVSPIDLHANTMNSDPLSPEVDIEDYYKAAWRRYNNCTRGDMMYQMNLITDDTFYDKKGNADV